MIDPFTSTDHHLLSSNPLWTPPLCLLWKSCF